MTAIRSQEEMVTAVPFLIGYQPTDSMVIVGISGEEGIECTMRVDYPTETHFEHFEQLAKTIMAQGVKEVVLVTYLPDKAINHEPVTDLHITLNHYKIEIVDSIIVYDGKYKSILETNAEEHTVPDIKSSSIAMEQVVNGRPLPFDNRASMKASLSSYTEITEIVSHLKTMSVVDDQEGRRLGVQTFDKLLKEFDFSGKCSDFKDVAVLLNALKDVVVRDYLLGIINDDNAQTMTNLLRWLLLVAPEGYKAPIATLNAAVAYEYGMGAEAHALLDIADEDEANYSLSTLLRRVFTAGWPPASFKQMRDELHPKVVASLLENA